MGPFDLLVLTILEPEPQVPSHSIWVQVLVPELRTNSHISMELRELCKTTGHILSYKEHCKTTGHNLSAVGEHCAMSKHKPDIESCKILDTAEGYYNHKVKESLYIQEIQPVLNRERGLELPSIYGEVLSCARGSSSHMTSQ